MKDSDIAKADPEFLQMMEDLEKQLQAHPVVLSQNCCSQCFYNALGQGLKEGQEQLQKSQEEAERLADLGAVNSSGTSQQQAATVMTVTYSATMSHWQVSQTDSNGR